jgi:hypothetical protein
MTRAPDAQSGASRTFRCEADLRLSQGDRRIRETSVSASPFDRNNADDQHPNSDAAIDEGANLIGWLAYPLDVLSFEIQASLQQKRRRLALVRAARTCAPVDAS